MRRMAKLIKNLGARGVLLALGGMATLASATCGAYGPQPCTTDPECTWLGEGSYCDQEHKRCDVHRPDAGPSLDAGSATDGGP
jgi:hypothetical protein